MELKCIKCGKCCKDGIIHKGFVVVYPSEINNFAELFSCNKKDFLSHYCVRDEITVHNRKVSYYIIKKEKGKCMFLKDNLCSIYENRPIQCRLAPYGYFAYKSLWKKIKCVDSEKLKKCNSIDNDTELMKELLKGYEEYI
ncbi:MAG: YkgJ family cysteine cluster protein [Lachnospiraceae bacterium]|nr:YkgJ family cysteine cluster protein [Lachnospiraceae bacterium]